MSTRSLNNVSCYTEHRFKLTSILMLPIQQNDFIQCPVIASKGPTKWVLGSRFKGPLGPTFPVCRFIGPLSTKIESPKRSDKARNRYTMCSKEFVLQRLWRVLEYTLWSLESILLLFLEIECRQGESTTLT